MGDFHKTASHQTYDKLTKPAASASQRGKRN